MDGCFITFEGGEGAGKTTQIERLRKRLESLGHDVLVTREPGGSPKAEEIRRFILAGHAKHLGAFTEALLFAAARIDHLTQTIRPALNHGRIVICDRFVDSTRVYQGVLGNLDEETIGALERVTVDGTMPDLTLILDLPAEKGLARAERRRESRGEDADRFEAEAPDLHERLRQGFLRVAEAFSWRCAVIDAGRDVDRVEEAVWKITGGRLPRLSARKSAHVA